MGAILPSPFLLVVSPIQWSSKFKLSHPSSGVSPVFWGLTIVVMAPRSWAHTIDIECKSFPSGTMSVDVVKGVLDYFKTELPEYKVVSV